MAISNCFDFIDHARKAMAADAISEDGVHHVVRDADSTLHYDDGRTHYIGMWHGRTFSVIVENDGVTVVTVFERKRERRRRKG